jgi:hypothetical protein
VRLQAYRFEAVLRRDAQHPVSLREAAPGAALLGLLALVGCGSFSHESKTPAEACPSATILRPLANTAIFAPGSEPRPENVAFYGLLSEVDSKCTYSAGAVMMTLDVIVIGQRGPVAKDNAVDLNYFVAVTTPQQEILSKKPFSVRIVFPPDRVRAGVTDHIDEEIPLDGHKGSDLTVDLGFQQSPEVVDFYQRFRGRSAAPSAE